MANLFSLRTKEKKLYAAYQRAKAKRRRARWHLWKAGVSFEEMRNYPEHQKVSQECSRAYRKWDDFWRKIEIREETC